MKKKISRKQRKIFLMLIVVFITAVTLAVETYAWFVGLSTASTGDITIAISSADGIELSLNGQYWTSGVNQLKIKDNSHTYITETGCSNANCAYTGHKNKWPTSLVPVSSIGEINSSTSRLKMYEKKSLTANPGGYYVASSQISNSTNEADKYVTFDLFIRNGKGSAYNGTYSMASEEDIYLSADSLATTVVSGTQPDYGAANSVRVGVFEIARVGSSGYTPSNIASATCTTNTNGITPLCTGSTGMTNPNNSNPYSYDELQYNTWNIWEPNHASHSTQLVSYFNQSCKKRTGVDTYTDSCQPIETGSAKKTYAMNNAITTLDTDIYDGEDLNEYNLHPYLKEINTYKTSDATTVGKDKPSLLKLAGNSVTKLRVYIWLEGQDIDNFDIITKNPSVQVKFGFTKDRYGVDTTNNNAMNNRTSSFQDDSWEKIKQNIQNNNTSQYKVGDMRTIRINGNEYRLRLANKSSPTAMCSNSSYSQTACGFVVEFYDAVTQMKMKNESGNNTTGGYPATLVFTYLNGELWNNLPDDLKSVIINTRVISSHNPSDPNNFISDNQKLYLLSSTEVYTGVGGDTASGTTRQLDYYSERNVSSPLVTQMYARKQYDGSYVYMWLRNVSNTGCSRIRANGELGYAQQNALYGVAPAFRIA